MARQPKKTSAHVANENAGILKRQIAPWPAADRWVNVLGSNVNVAYLSSVLRISQQGFRQQLVDVLDELLERDPHAQAVLSQRSLAVSGAQVELTPAEVQDKSRAPRALEIKNDLQRRFNAIPSRAQSFTTLVFASLYYGAGAAEIMWEPRADGWWITGLEFIHSRRIAAPDQSDWQPHIWDQGSVSFESWGTWPSERLFGLRMADYPGKFLDHRVQVRGDYWLREGLGRVIGWWMLFKLIGARGAPNFVERFGKPWAIANYSTGEETTNGKPRAADDDDIKKADLALAALGSGSLTAATIPDSIKIQLMGPGMNATNGVLIHEKLIDLCDSQTSKAVRGGTLTTDAGEKGARSLGEVHEEGDVRNARFDAACLAETLKRDVVWWLCHLNYPGEEDLCPGVTIHVEKVSPVELLERALKLAASNVPVDGRAVATLVGVPLIKADDPDAVRMAPLKPTDLFALLPQAAHDLPNALEAIAAMTGVALTPAMKSAIAEMDRDDAARVLQELLGAAKAREKETSKAGAAADVEAPEPADDETAEAPTPAQTPAKKGGAPPDAPTPERPQTQRGPNPVKDEGKKPASAPTKKPKSRRGS